MSKSALIIGRFQPIHVGHLSLIERYHRAGFFIKIGIGSSNNSLQKHHPLTADEREEKIKGLMKEAKIKNYKIFHIPDIRKDKYYVKHVLKIVGRFDIIITGNPSVLKLFLKYHSQHSWNIESFEESISRPKGNITSGIIRRNWLKKPSRNGLPESVFRYLKKLNFSKRLKELK